MGKIIVYLLWILSFTSVAAAQSGRKITPTPTPDQFESPKDPATETETVYSESKPLPKRAVMPLPDLRNVSDNDSKTKDRSNKKEIEVLSDSENDVVKVETNLITIPVSVFDRNGLYIPNLAKNDFRIFEDGKEQPIEFFATTENPFTVLLLLDTSPSTAFKIEEIQDAAIAFVNQLKPQDSVMVIEFDENMHVLTKPTQNREKIYKAIRKADFGGGTSIYDAVDFSLRKHLSKITGRKAIVLFTDGVDTTSHKRDYDSSLREAEEADATIFPIYFNTFSDNQRRNGGFGSRFPQLGSLMRGVTREEYAVGKQYLEDLADTTGGRVFNAENTPGGLTRTFESIAEELRRQYSIGYIPTEIGQPGQRKMIKVRVDRPKLIIRARDSYIVGAAANNGSQINSTKSQ